jgi:hypothetical protein
MSRSHKRSPWPLGLVTRLSINPDAGIFGRWFVGGICNTCWNAVDRHIMQGRGEQPAIIYDSPLAGLPPQSAMRS